MSPRRRPRRGQRPPRHARRRGATLVELMMALSIFTGVAVGIAAYVGRMVHAVAVGGATSAANDLVTDRLEAIQSTGDYAAIDRFAGTESAIRNYPTYVRRTYVQRVGGSASSRDDYKIVTVSVTSPAVRRPVKKTTVIAAF